MENVRRHTQSRECWEYFVSLYYIQMAVRIMMLKVGRKSSSAIKNNYNSLKKIGALYKEKGYKFLSFGNLQLAEKVV